MMWTCCTSRSGGASETRVREGSTEKIWVRTSNSRIMRYTPWTLAGRPLIVWRCMWFYGTFCGRRCWDLVDEAWWGYFFIENCEPFGASECPSTFQLGSTYLQQSCRDYSPGSSTAHLWKMTGKEDYITNFPLVGKVTFQGREPLKLPKGVYIPQELTCIPLYTQNDAFKMVTPF